MKLCRDNRQYFHVYLFHLMSKICLNVASESMNENGHSVKPVCFGIPS